MSAMPRVTFGVIVLDGEPFTRYCLRALYPFAHQIVVVEGAAPAAAGIATPDGHSADGTLGVLRDFQAREDPERKVAVVTAEDEGHPDGFWPGEKDEQSRAYAKRATGDWLWQVDVDEFYQPDDMRAVLALLSEDPAITVVSFKQITFWGGLDVWVDGWYLRRHADTFRVFKWSPGYRYVCHRPPTVLDASGRDLRTLGWVDGEATARRGIRLYHYSLLLPAQVAAKARYYSRADWAGRGGMARWADEAFLALRRPYRVHNVYEYPSWLEPFRGRHPPQVLAMWEAILAGRLGVRPRDGADVARLLRSPGYRCGRAALKALVPLGRVYVGWRPRWRRLRRAPVRTVAAWWRKWLACRGA